MKKILSFLLVIGMLLPCYITGFAEENIVEISNKDELMTFAAAVNNGDYNNLSDTTVILTDNIDLANKTWVPIGTISEYFPGTFDGNNKTISNLALKLTTNGSYVGFFSINAAKIQNLNINGTITVEGLSNIAYCGGIAGANLAEITNCKSDFTITSTTAAGSKITGAVCGGIAGYCENAVISDCESNMNLTYVGLPYSCYNGGIVGHAAGATILNCTSKGTVTLTGMPIMSNFGGISGLATLSEISNCTNETVFKMSAECNSSNFGGISGIADRAKIYKCRNIADATITATYYGGIAGQIYVSSGATGSSVINNCYNSGNINCISTESGVHTGGIAGYTSGDVLIKNSYSMGTITSKVYKGAIVSSLTPASATVANCYFTDNAAVNGAGLLSASDTSLLHGLTVSDIGTKKTAEEMRSQAAVDALNKGGDYIYNDGGYPTFGTKPEDNNTRLYMSPDLNVAAADVPGGATMIIASYNNGKLIDITMKQVAGHMMLKINSDIINTENANEVKVFMFDGLSSIVPLCESVFESIQN